MDVTRVDDVFFDDAATAAMGAAFDQTRRLLRRSAPDVPELIARRIIEAAKNGERDAARLRSQALRGFRIDDVSMPTISVARDVRVPLYASIAHHSA